MRCTICAGSVSYTHLPILPILFGEYAEATNQYGVPGSTYYDDTIGIKYDLEKAKALMEEAGYPDGFSTTLTVVNSERSIQFCQIVAEQLAQIGIDVELNIVAVSYTHLDVYKRQAPTTTMTTGPAWRSCR